MSMTTEEILRSALKDCIKAMEAAHESMFTQCLSNPSYNVCGKRNQLQ